MQRGNGPTARVCEHAASAEDDSDQPHLGHTMQIDVPCSGVRSLACATMGPTVACENGETTASDEP